MLDEDAGEVALSECRRLFGRGSHAELCEKAASLLEPLAGDACREWRCEALRMLAAAHSEIGDFDEAMRLARQIVHEAAIGKDSGLALVGACAVGACFDRIGNPWQSILQLKSALDAHEAAAPVRQRLIAHINMCAYHGDTWYRLRSVGSGAEREEQVRSAQRHAAAAVALLAQHDEPMLEVVARGNLAEALLLGGDTEAAAPMLAHCLEMARTRGFQAYEWRMRCTWATLLLARGDAAAARSEAESLLAAMGNAPPRPTEIRARDIAFQSCQALGEPAAALAHFLVFEHLERLRTLAELRAQSQLFVPRAEAEKSQRQAELLRDASEAQSRLVELAQRRAETDEMTGLANRTGLLQAFGKMDPSRWALVALDLDHFKQVNDQLGHAAGDAVLIGFAEVLRQCTRNNDVLARVGGDEFVILLPGADLEAARDVCERLRVALHRRQAWPAPLTEPLEVTVSMGLVTSSEPGLQSALAAADKALYGAKRQGRNRVGLADLQAAATE